MQKTNYKSNYKSNYKRALIALVFAFTTISSHATGLNIDLMPWLGYGITANSTYGEFCESARRSGSSCARGGFSFGADAYFSDLGPFRFGLGAAYIPIIDSSYSFTGLDSGSIVKTSGKTKVTNIPFMALFKYNIPALPIFVGGMAGYSFASGSSTVTTTINNIPVTAGFGGAAVGGAFTIGGFAGYAFKPLPSPLVSIDAGLKMYLMLGFEIIVQFVPFVGATFAF